MQKIHVIFQGGSFKPLEHVDLPENARVTLAVLDDDDLSSDGIAKSAGTGGAFDFLNDPREDIYSESDGEAI